MLVVRCFVSSRPPLVSFLRLMWTESDELCCGGRVHDLFVANLPFLLLISTLIQHLQPHDQVFVALQESQPRGEQGRRAGGLVRGRCIHRVRRLNGKRARAKCISCLHYSLSFHFLLVVLTGLSHRSAQDWIIVLQNKNT